MSTEKREICTSTDSRRCDRLEQERDELRADAGELSSRAYGQMKRAEAAEQQVNELRADLERAVEAAQDNYDSLVMVKARAERLDDEAERLGIVKEEYRVQVNELRGALEGEQQRLQDEVRLYDETRDARPTVGHLREARDNLTKILSGGTE